jgi:hypothetical protein
LDEFTNDNRSQREGISELVNTLNGTVEQIKKSRVNRIGENDIMEKLTESMSKLILTATQAVTKKVTTAIKQIPIYVAEDFAPFSRQTGK